MGGGEAKTALVLETRFCLVQGSDKFTAVCNLFASLKSPVLDQKQLSCSPLEVLEHSVSQQEVAIQNAQGPLGGFFFQAKALSLSPFSSGKSPWSHKNIHATALGVMSLAQLQS